MKPITFIYLAQAERQTNLYPPLGVCYLISSLKKVGFRTRVIDLTFDVNLLQLSSINEEDKGSIYCISFTTPYRNMAAHVIKKIKDNDPESTVISGGAHPTILPEDTMEIKGTDIAVIGQGDYVLPEVVKTIVSKADLKDVKNIRFKKNGEIIKTPTEDTVKNLDDLDFPSQGDFPIEEYFKRKGFRELSLITSRGCPMKCTFCKPAIDKIFGSKLLFRSVENVVDEIEMITKNYNLDSFFFSDDTFTMNQNMIIELCNEMMRRKINTFWRCASTVKVKKETLRVMRKAGCLSISFGVESGSPQILRNIKKNITIEETTETFKLCKELGIITWAFLMVGNPGETKETGEMTKKLVRKIRPFGSSVSITTPMPGTTLYDYAKKENMLASSADMDFDYLFSNSHQNMLKLPDLSRQKILLLKRELENTAAHSTERVRDILRLGCHFLTMKRLIIRILSNPGFIRTFFTFLLRIATIKSLNILNLNAGKKIGLK